MLTAAWISEVLVLSLNPVLSLFALILMGLWREGSGETANTDRCCSLCVKVLSSAEMHHNEIAQIPMGALELVTQVSELKM